MWYPIRILMKAETDLFKQEQYYKTHNIFSEERKEFYKAWDQLLLALRILKYVQNKFQKITGK